MTQDENTTLRTANKLYMTSEKQVEKVVAFPELMEIFRQTRALSKALAYDLQESLLFGKIEAAAAIAYLYRQGLGVEQSEDKCKLYTAIGGKLGHSGCQGLTTEKDYSEVEDQANIVVKIIQENKKKHPNKDAVITVRMSAEVREKIEAKIPGILIAAPSTQDIEIAKNTLPRAQHRHKLVPNKTKPKSSHSCNIL